MQAGKPSRTALGAAGHRAAHQVLEGGRIFSDPLALRIMGGDAELALRDARENPAQAPMRAFVSARSRFAEDALAAAQARGVSQLVVLGAGLDTFAYRAPRAGLRMFEVDHPDTQTWKRSRLADAGIAAPDNLTYVPVNFERDTLDERLAAAGFGRNAQSFFMWLGVTPYLTKDAIWATLGWIGALPAGAHVVFDYGEPREAVSDEARAYMQARMERVAALGEPWISFFEPAALHAKLRELGFRDIEDMRGGEIGERYLGLPKADTPAVSGGGHILRASTV
ncbi:MAG: SAM-dependent methyltransferase [Vitreimonas sp.]